MDREPTEQEIEMAEEIALNYMYSDHAGQAGESTEELQAELHATAELVLDVFRQLRERCTNPPQCTCICGNKELE